MANSHRATCRYCGKHRSEVGPISWAGYCGEHGKVVWRENIDNLHEHRGPWFEHWRRAMAACVGAQLVDDDASSA